MQEFEFFKAAEMIRPAQVDICVHTLGFIVNELQLCSQLISRGGKLRDNRQDGHFYLAIIDPGMNILCYIRNIFYFIGWVDRFCP